MGGCVRWGWLCCSAQVRKLITFTVSIAIAGELFQCHFTYPDYCSRSLDQRCPDNLVCTILNLSCNGHLALHHNNPACICTTT